MKNTPVHQTEILDQNQISYLESWITFYAKKNNLTITIDTTLDAPAAVPDTTTWATPTIIINPNLCIQKLNLTQEEFLMVMFHEIEHLREDVHLLSTPEGKSIANQRTLRQKNHGKRASSYHFIENIFRDVFVNTQVVETENIPIFRPVLHNLYKTKLFQTTDYSKDRKHKQFGYAIVREAFVPEEQCIVDQQIRKIIDRFRKSGIIEKATTWTFAERLLNIRKLIEPTYKKLLQEDKENYDKNKEDKKGWENQEGKPWEGWKPQQGEANPFEDEYKEVPDHILEDSLKPQDLEKLKKQLQDQAKETQKTPEQRALEQRVKNMWIDPKDKEEFEQTLQKLKQYDNYRKNVLENIKDAQTWELVRDEIVQIFKVIKAHRKKRRYVSKAPVDIEHGTRLHPWAIANGIAEMKWGNENPEMFEMDIIRQKSNYNVGNFEIMILADGTGSMRWEKNTQQKIAILLIMEALKELNDLLEIEKTNLQIPLKMQSEVHIFGKNSRKIKEKSSDFTDKERIQTFSALDEHDGPDNNEWLLVEKIYQEFKEESDSYHREIKAGKIKKIIFVFTDGDQDVDEYKKKLIDNMQNFRQDGVLVYGIGITSAGKSVLSLYHSDNPNLGWARVCLEPSQLAVVIKELLLPHLASL